MRTRVPDKKNALSILEAAKGDMGYALTLKVSEKSSSTIVRNIYESFRMLGDALLKTKGLEPEKDKHIAEINELLKLKVNTSRPINLLDNLRRLRHNINYNGYKPTILETEDALSLAKGCFKPLVDAVLKEVNK